MEASRTDDHSGGVALIADTIPIERPARLDDFSSHAMLWETLRREIDEHPEAVGTDAGEYLERKIRTYGVAEEGLDRAIFIERLIRPAFAWAVARSLIGAGLRPQLFGEGSARLDEFAVHAGGPIRSREELTDAIAASRVLIHCWPERHAHPVEAAGRPVVRAAGKPRGTILREIREALHRRVPNVTREQVLNRDTIVRRLGAFESRTIAA